ncbi:MAG: pantetheine-phosphate adenylyltransferase [Caldilineales bacterium]
MTVALYPGSFDPIHNGHIDVATRAAHLFQRLVVAIYDNPASKRLLFSTEQRVELARGALAHLSNVEVIPYRGLTAALAQQIGAAALVRGLRASADYEYEAQLAHANKALAAEVETVMLLTSLQYAYLSATILKEVAALGGDITQWAPQAVQDALHRAR